MKLVQKHTYNTNLQLKKLKTEKKLVLHIDRLKALSAESNTYYYLVFHHKRSLSFQA